MSTNILMPALSPTMTEGKLARWLKKEGDEVKSGDVLAEIETDKATMEVEAVDEGFLAKIVVPDDTEGVAVNAVIAILTETKGGAIEAPKEAPKAAAKAEPAPAPAPAAQAAPAPQPANGAGPRRAHFRLASGQAHRQAGRHRPVDRQGLRPEWTDREGRSGQGRRRTGRSAGASRAGPCRSTQAGRAGAGHHRAAQEDPELEHAQGHRQAPARIQADRAAFLCDARISSSTRC